ncbi:MAG TPA: protein kinase [Polyangia bacterium]|jgi:tetratricopeptide (TPR) repeat protein/tRNA A-37 threonylcarbamoyl transferase component Bud32|nr:protein kinase [Polyangia bacterium]
MKESTMKGIGPHDARSPQQGSGNDQGLSNPTGAAARVDLTAGELVPGTRYRILSKLGQGGMGAVYAAEHVDIERKVALKVLRADIDIDAETLKQFRQEARATSKIGSAFICDVTDFGEIPDGRVFFVMEYLDGPSLGRVMRETDHLDPARTVAILRQISKGLGAAHEKKMVHLDVKPDNIMLVSRDKRADAVKIVDFGIAGLIHQKVEEEVTLAGTPEYIAPERAAGEGFDHRSDVYALGVLGYEMLCGAVPFHGRTSRATLTMQVKDVPTPLAKRATQRIPEPLQALVMTMLAKDPAARPQSMAEVEALLCEAQIAAGFVTPWDDLELPAVDEEWRARLAKRMPAPGSRSRKAVLAVTAGIAIVAAGASIYLGAIRKPEVIIREVRVELTKTEEAPAVATALMNADQAARNQRYTRPAHDSALSHIQSAEAEAAKLGRTSAGAMTLRRAYASALAVIGNELLKSGLGDLAIPKYKEALLFLPDDSELQAKAELTPEERKSRQRPVATGPTPTPPAPAPPVDNAREAATRIFVAATQRRPSEARLAMKMLADFDIGGVQTARLADGLRTRAAAEWKAGHLDNAQMMYQLIAQLDPQDAEARERAKPPTAADTKPEPAPAALALAAAPAAAKGKRKEAEPAADTTPELARDPVAAQKAAEAGAAALGRGRLGEAESWFNRAVRADASNVIGVAGLAEVAFERAKYSEAMDYARRAARLSPKTSKYLVLLGDAYFKLLRYDQAQATYQQARTLAPTDEGIKNRLARVEAKLAR